MIARIPAAATAWNPYVIIRANLRSKRRSPASISNEQLQHNLSMGYFAGKQTMEPGGSRIWLIAKKEILANIRNFKTPVALVTMTLLSLLSAHTLALDYRNRLNNWSVNREIQSDPFVRGSVSYDLSDGSFTHAAGIGRTPPIQPPQPFSALVKGMDSEMDRAVSVSQRIVFGARQNEPATSALFDTPDTSFVIKLLVSLFALMFSLDAVTREKEFGTLRAMLSQPIRRRELILSKSLGASISLLGAFAVAYFVEIIYLHLAQGLLSDGQDLVRAALIFGLASLYGIVFVHIGLFISTITTRTRIAVTTALLTWATVVLLLPNAAVLMAKLLTPTQSYNQLNARLYEARKRILQEEFEANPTAWLPPQRPVSRQSLPRLFEIERQVTDNYLASKKDQNRQARLFSALSPAGALAFGLSDLASTGVDAYNSYLELFRSSRDVMIDALKRGLELPPQSGDKLAQEVREAAANRQRRTEPLGVGLRSSIIHITSMLAWAVFFGLAADWRLKRYDVR
jgi:ABC-type transport system involved in multi-copper enzyme maturation permease subunit